MKKLLFLLTAFLFSSLVYAQPSNGTLLAKIKKEHSRVISAKLLGNGISERVYENNAWHYNYRRSYTVKTKTKYSGITYVYSGAIQYRKVGGRYVYSKLLVGDGHYEGVPNPNKDEILKLVKSDLEQFLQNHHYNKIYGKISNIKLADNPEWFWHKLNSVRCNMNVTYTEAISYTKLQTAEHTYEVRLYSDKYKAPWKSFFSSRLNKKTKVIEEKTYTSNEIRAMKTLADMDLENKAKADINDLPKVGKIPDFKSDKQLFYFLHEKIMKEDSKTVEAYLRKLMSKSCYYKNSDVVLTRSAAKWYNNLIEGHEAYKMVYCLYPAIKHQQNSVIEFYDKEKHKILRYVADFEDKKWKIREISFYPPSKAEQNRMKNMNNNCGEKPNLTVRKIIRYKVGDKVNGKFSNGVFPATIAKTDPYNKSRYFIKLDSDSSGKGYWMKEQFLTKREGDEKNKKNKNKSVDNSSNSNGKKLDNKLKSFKVGDKVKVKTTKGMLKAKIIKKIGKRYLVKFRLPVYSNIWVKANQMQKR